MRHDSTLPPDASRPPAAGGASEQEVVGSGDGNEEVECGSESHKHKVGTFALALSALGVVYGDIGTSPLYAIKECFNPEFGLAPTPDNVIGICSLAFWAMMWVVVIKYLIFVMRADNNGEGGVLALMALLTPRDVAKRRWVSSTSLVTMLALVGTALLGADGTITPAISVLSAVEGLEVATPFFKPFVIPATIAIIVGVFMLQKRGTARISSIFGPVMVVWFVSLIVMAIPPLLQVPGIFAALNPFRGIKLLFTHGWHGFLVLGAVVLCVTGAEALYADMGHFGRKAIKMAWYPLVMPALIFNYFGQGAKIIATGGAAATNPFYALAPGLWIYPAVVIATLAAIIASQALISGAFSLAQQAVQLGYSPRLTIIHTSERTKGQIYVPEINFLLMASCVALVLLFKESTKLAGAYGIAVIGTMAITSILISLVAVQRWGWTKYAAGLLLAAFLTVDFAFLIANLPKIQHGGWFSIAVCIVVFTIMTTWKRGRMALVQRMARSFLPVDDFVRDIRQKKPYRVPGTAIFMTSNPRVVPSALRHHFQHNQVLHEQVLLLSILTADSPKIPVREVVEVKEHGDGFYEIVANFGFMQKPTMDRILRLFKLESGVEIDEESTTYYLGRDVLLIDGPERMARWRKMLFAYLMRNSLSATAYYGIPPNRVVELGMQVNL